MASSTSNIEAALRRLAKEKNLRGGKDTKGETVLHFAASEGCVGSCRFLVEELGFDVNCVSNTGVTPMLFAAFEGNVQVMRYLLDHGGDPAMPDDKGSTPLHLAAEEGHYEAARLLLSKGVRADPIDHRGTPLHLAAAKDHDQVVKVLLEHGADPNRVVHHVFSPLMMAVRGKALKCMRLLIEAGADVNAHGYSGPTPLTEAVDDGLTNFVKVLLEAGADPNIPNQVMEIDPFDAAMFANRSLCWLREGEGDRALQDAQQCRMMRPGWSKAWYREGTALRFMKDYKGAAAAFRKALQLDPRSNEIKEALREATKYMEEMQRD
ncbi:hypothetical protein ACQ4PT_042945 [Festuca glaucescens]